MQTTIYFVRHGEIDNPQQLYYGRLPGYHLSETGQAQARAAAAYLENVELSAVYTSPQLRARQTAEVICAKHQRLIPQTLELLNEVYTPYDGTPYAELVPRDFDLYTDSAPPFEQPDDI
jgi:broad specificity phosphatase PhoE